MKHGRPDPILIREDARRDARTRKRYGVVIALGKGTATVKSATGLFQRKPLVGAANIGDTVELQYIDGDYEVHGTSTASAGGASPSLFQLINGAAMAAISAVKGGVGDPVRVQEEMSFDLSPNTGSGVILFREPFHGSYPIPSLGMWNDGVVNGSAALDWEVPFDGRPTIRLDLQGADNGSATDPGSSPDILGIVFKRRLQFPIAGTYGVEMWIRWTSPNQTNTLTSISLYNRNGTDATLGRLWIKNTVTPVELYYLNSGGTYTLVNSINMSTATHLYDPSTNRLDRAGQWTFARLIVDFTNLRYVGFQIDQVWYDLTGVAIHSEASSGARAMHFSIEYGSSTATQRRYLNVTNIIGRRYS